MFSSILGSLFPSMKNSSTTPPIDPPAADESAGRITGSTWDVHPISQPATAPWHRNLSGEDFAKLYRGYQPSAMEDRWMCRSDGPDERGNMVVHVYRSWTGHEQFQIKVESRGSHGPADRGAETDGSDGQKAAITEITWDEGGEDTKVSEEDAKNLATMVCKRVLKCELD
ncbi:hypothetical protein CMUS01_10461 [Colletotrichum musicola]|uniref:Uncharacterized protein n=1 Tax=Colletotrichum musicola TaxID=2175873 RepID=A0A8H6K467_9PEZI|nr:hypothetical protein CMUS01_10461 [Colletotrichum musicola]